MSSGRLRWKTFWHKISHWEFWPFSILYFPVNFYFVWLAIRCRSLFFFTASNPSIEFGGMLGEQKSKIFELIPDDYIPKYRLIKAKDFSSAQSFAAKIGFPIICKPEIGERGKLVEKITTEEALKQYVEKSPVDFLIQELVGYPIELGVFYIRHPDESEGRVTSIVMKEFLQVIGDGKLTVRELLETNIRAALQLNIDHHRFAQLMGYRPAKGEKVEVESIGNHCRGTAFYSANHRISNKLNQTINQLAQQIEGLYFGRFDLRCQSFESLENLEQFKILELNGAGAEPAHIYHPGASLWRGYRDILWHLDQLAQISRKNHKRGVPYWTTTAGLKKLKEIRRYNQRIKHYL